MVEMPSLEGEERILQEKRVKDLLDAANEQQSLLDLARIGPRVPHSDNYAPRRLNLLAQSALLEEDGPIGPACLGPRIRGVPFPIGFTLPRDTPKYNDTTKPQDWLIDYTNTVGIAWGNKRVAVRYVPLMLAGSAHTWLNSLPADNVNSWVDFEEAFVRNFTGTYKRPCWPRELAMSVQRPDEPLRDYVTCWTELRNSCEGVHEVQAIQYFIDGCRDGTLLKHKLMCSEPTSLAVLMAKADKYATADSAMRFKVTVSDKIVPRRLLPSGLATSEVARTTSTRRINLIRALQASMWLAWRKIATTTKDLPMAPEIGTSTGEYLT
ncbi:Endoglucanase 3 [Hordeum vulgare]|nr:Endoglucanase 3 [Hordeum vulgare]